MIDFDRVENKPILILSSPRTGSTVLGAYISGKLNYKFFNEPYSSVHRYPCNDFFRYAQSSTSWVLKEHASCFSKYYTNAFLNKDIFIIRIKRKNLFDQVVSAYISELRGKYFYVSSDNTNRYKLSIDIGCKAQLYEDDKFKPDQLPLIEEKLLNQVSFIKQENIKVDIIKYKVDLDLYYEDLEFNEPQLVLKTPKPINYNELLDWAKEVCKDKL